MWQRRLSGVDREVRRRRAENRGRDRFRRKGFLQRHRTTQDKPPVTRFATTDARRRKVLSNATRTNSFRRFRKKTKTSGSRNHYRRISQRVRFDQARPSARELEEGAGRMSASRHERSFHNRALRELLEPALRDFYEAPGAPRQIPFGSDSRVQIAD